QASVAEDGTPINQRVPRIVDTTSSKESAEEEAEESGSEAGSEEEAEGTQISAKNTVVCKA
ncbi:hypothetical protein, partial [Escherichia coli]|uniref:hypothetical protein n=1 Tax=Escherichia coli TaxID=562 RepID=UPI001C5949E8